MKLQGQQRQYVVYFLSQYLCCVASERENALRPAVWTSASAVCHCLQPLCREFACRGVTNKKLLINSLIYHS